MAAAFSSTVGAPASTPTNFLGKKLKKQVTSAVNYHGKSSKANRFTVMAAENIDEKRNTDKWKGLAYDISDDQQDITRGKGIVDSLFQAPTGDGTHEAVLSSYEYVSQGLKKYDFDNTMGGFYIAPAFMDKLVVHLSKNFMTLPNIKIPLILGIWGGKGQGKSFQCELVFAKMGINPIMMSAGELESGNAGEPAKLIRQRYREAADMIKKGKMCCLFINDLDAGAGRMGGTTQYTVNNQMVVWRSSTGLPPATTVSVSARVSSRPTMSATSPSSRSSTPTISCCIGGGKGAQQGTLPVPAGCTDQTAKNFDPTARSDDGSCLYTF
uniref:Ribulose bisphosphate carboxylase/oxygenase activase, chloroplastic n=1 Tax=Triticum urartu TaxID=4572 RepID=A0A8R7Q4P7_TRIUA